MIRNVFLMLRVPLWLRHYAFHGAPNKWLSPIRFVCGFFDLRPRNWCRKVNVRVRSIFLRAPKIGHVHIPKTGGRYVSSLFGCLPHINFSHVVVRRIRSDRLCPIGFTPVRPGKVNGYFLFSAVRNPLSFLVSYYNHVKVSDSKHYDYHLAGKGFEFMVEAIIGRTDKWPSRRLLFFQLFDQKGPCVVDWINRIESLDGDLADLAKHFGLSFEAGKRQGVGPKQKTFDTYYTESLLGKVCETYSREMAVFGYTGPDTTSPLIRFKPLEKNRIRYDYLDDRLYLDNKMLERCR